MPEVLTPEASADECAAWLRQYLSELEEAHEIDADAIAALKSVTAATPETAPHFRVTAAIKALHQERKRRQTIMSAIRNTLEEYES